MSRRTRLKFIKKIITLIIIVYFLPQRKPTVKGPRNSKSVFLRIGRISNKFNILLTGKGVGVYLKQYVF